MSNSYLLKKFNYSNGILNNSVDATYIIYLEGNNDRYNNIIKQLNNIVPTDTIYILFNKGWKKGIKRSYITNSAIDLIDANITCFNHANKKNYNNILILEDDFVFDNKLKDINVIKNIDNFLLSKIDTSFSFYLGTIPFIFYPYNLYINKSIFNIYTHSIIFSKKYRNNVLNYNYKNLICWDLFQIFFNFNRYYYNIPLIYQTIEETENSNNWLVPKFVRKAWLYLSKITKCDKDPRLFFKILYTLSYIFTIFIIFIIIYICIKFI